MVSLRPLALCLVPPLLVVLGLRAPVAPLDAAPPQEGAPPPAACIVCHPGSRASLERSPHASLVKADTSESCLACHKTGLDHQAHPRSSEHPPGRGATACVDCHAAGSVDAARAQAVSHPSKTEARRFELSRDARAPSPEPPATGLSAALQHFTAEGRVRAGWRFVHVDGDERAFDHDFGIDPGPRLSDLELRLRRDGHTLLDGSMAGLEDREFSAQAGTGSGLSERFSAKGGFRRNLYVYDAEGDYHTLSNTREWTTASAEFTGSGESQVRMSLDFERLDLDGRTINSRLGNPNQSPLAPATGVPVDRTMVSDIVRMGYEETPSWGVWGLEFAWEEARSRDDLRYARPSPANPGFTESEVSSSRSSRHGPETVVRSVVGNPDATQVQLLLSASQREVRYVETGQFLGWDTSSFSSTTLGNGDGDERRLAFVARATQALWAGGLLAFEGEWIELKQDIDFTLYDTTVRTSPPLIVDTREDLHLVTRLRERSARLGLEQELAPALTVDLGYRYLAQYLFLPDLTSGDSDYRAGWVKTHGPDLAADWRPDPVHSLRVRWTLASTDDRTPTETQPEVGHVLSARARRKLLEGEGQLEIFTKWRRGENDVSSTRSDYQSYGASLQLPPWAGARLEARGAWTQIRSETLTNFYLAPSIVPIPTYVSFRGDSFLVDLSLDAPLGGALRSITTCGLQTTSGSLDSSLLRCDEEVVWRTIEPLSLGVRGTFIRYDEDQEGGGDGYDAYIAFLFAELRF